MSNKKLLMKASSIMLDDDEGDAASEIQAGRPRTAPGQLMGLQAQHADALSQIDELKEQIKLGPFRLLPLDSLVEVPGRRRKLTDEEFAELRDNLAQHPMITPITVRDSGDGRFEIVSGHNRAAAYRVLGRTEIGAWIADAPADSSEELAFYANLLHPSLPDFEKYLGLKKIIATADDEMTAADLAARTGMSRQLVAQLLQFEDLPPEALSLLEKRPERLGSRIASKLAALATGGQSKKVIEAVRLLVTESEMDQKDALAWASAVDAPVQKKQAVRIRYGNKTYCTVQSSGKAIRLTFESDDDRAEMETVVSDLLKKQAAKRK